MNAIRSAAVNPTLCLLLLAALTLAVSPRSAGADEVLRRGLGPEPDSLDIHQAQGLAAINLLRDLREGLITFDAAGELAPGVAERWEILDGGTRYRFTLRADARWSNGDAVTAAQFVQAWHRAFAPGTMAVTAGLLRPVRKAAEVLAGEAGVAELGIAAPSPGLLDITLERPTPWLLELLAHPVSYPLHPAGTGQADDPVNGAYLLAERVPRAVLRLRRNAMFHSVSGVRSAMVEYYPIEEPNTELARYRAGELDVTETIPAGRYPWLVEEIPAELRVSPYLGSFWLGFNLRHAELGRSAELRRALVLAIDRATLVQAVLGAGEVPAWGIVPPGIGGYEPARLAEADWPQSEREERARELLEQSGYRGRGKPVLELRYNTSALHRRMAVAVAAMWKQVLGVNAELINEEWKVFVSNRRLGRVTEIFRGGWIADYADPATFLDLFRSGSELNATFLADGEFDRLMAEAAQLDGARRLARLAEAEARLLELTPVIPLYYYVSRHLVKPGVRGFENNLRDIHLSRYLYRE